jgi:hypothetical protein
MTRSDAGTRARFVARCAVTTLLGLASVSWLTFALLYVNDRDPYLGYTSDPEFVRAFVWVILPGAAWVLAASVAGIVWLTSSRVLATLTIVLGVPVMVTASWWPLGAALRHTF